MSDRSTENDSSQGTPTNDAFAPQLLQKGDRVWWWTIPRGSTELQWIPAIHVSRKEGKAALITAQIIDGRLFPIMLRTEDKNIRYRWEKIDADAWLRDYMAVITNQRATDWTNRKGYTERRDARAASGGR